MQTPPALNGNWVDLIIIAVLTIYIIDGVRRGLILGLLDLLSFTFSFFAAIQMYDLAAVLLQVNFNLPLGIAHALGFLFVGFATELILSLTLRRLVVLIPFEWRANRTVKILGILPAITNTVIITAFILTLFITLPIQGSIKNTILSSKLGGPLVRNTQGIEKQLNTVFGSAVEETLTFLTVQPTSEDTVELHFTQTEVSIDEASEQKMFELINQERTERGIAPLEFAQGRLQDLAREYSKDMFARGYLSHYNPEEESPFDRMENAGINYLAAGENLALAPTVTLAHQGLMNSPGHKANILSPDYGKIGIGVIDGGIYGKMFVQEFTD